MSDSLEDDFRATIFIDVPLEASAEEVDRFMDAVSVLAYDFDREGWDPLVYAHIRHGEQS